MNENQAANVLREDYTTVRVTFSSSTYKGRYTYKVPLDMAEALKVGDYLVVPVDGDDMSSARLKVARVQEVHSEPELDFESPMHYRWAVSPVYLEPYLLLLEQDKAIVTAFKRVKRRQEVAQLRAVLAAELRQKDLTLETLVEQAKKETTAEEAEE